jgi:Na+-driven multidrug efflux pump
MSDNKTIAKNTIFLYVRSFLMMAINLYASRVILEALGVSDYGLYGAIGSIVMMFAIINGVLSVGTSRFLTFELGRNDLEKLKKTFSASFMLHAGMALGLLVLLETVGLWFLNYKMNIPAGRGFAANILYQCSILSCIFAITQVPYSAIIIAHEKMSIYAYVGIAEAIFKLALVLFLVYVPASDNLIAYGLILALWSVCLQVFYRYYCYKKFEESHLSICRDKAIYKSMLSYGSWDLIGQFCGTGNTQGINILINIFFGVTVNAARTIAYQVENAITQFSANFMMSVNPQIVKSYARGDYNRSFQLIYEAGRYSFYLLFMVSLPVFLEADYILKLWLKDVPDYTVLFLRCVMVISLMRVFSRPLINGVHATGNVKILNLTSGVYSASTFLPLVYLLYKLDYPVWICFIVQAFNMCICSWLEVRALYKEIKFDRLDYFKKVYVHSIGVSFIACLLPVSVIYMMDDGPARLIFISVVSVLSTSVCVYFMGLNKVTRQKVNSFYIKKIYNLKSR